MTTSNAERQRRFRERRKAQAAAAQTASDQLARASTPIPADAPAPTSTGSEKGTLGEVGGVKEVAATESQENHSSPMPSDLPAAPPEVITPEIVPPEHRAPEDQHQHRSTNTTIIAPPSQVQEITAAPRNAEAADRNAGSRERNRGSNGEEGMVQAGTAPLRARGRAAPVVPCVSQEVFEDVCRRYATGEPWAAISASHGGIRWSEVTGRAEVQGNVEAWLRSQEDRKAHWRIRIEAVGQTMLEVAAGTKASRVEVASGPTGRTRKAVRERAPAAAMAAAALLAPETHGKAAGKAVEVNVGIGIRANDAKEVLIAVAQGADLGMLPQA